MPQVFELRHYIPAAGKAEALAKRFTDLVFPLIEKHRLELKDYWESADGSGEIWYVMAWPDEAAIKKGWDLFRDDPEWVEGKAASETDGVLVSSSRSIVLRQPAYYQG